MKVLSLEALLCLVIPFSPVSTAGSSALNEIYLDISTFVVQPMWDSGNDVLGLLLRKLSLGIPLILTAHLEIWSFRDHVATVSLIIESCCVRTKQVTLKPGRLGLRMAVQALSGKYKTEDVSSAFQYPKHSTSLSNNTPHNPFTIRYAVQFTRPSRRLPTKGRNQPQLQRGSCRVPCLDQFIQHFRQPKTCRLCPRS